MDNIKPNVCEQLRLENQLCFPLYAASRQIVNKYTPHLKPLGITYTQYLVFLVLGECGEMKVSEIGSKLMLDNGTLSPLLKKLEKEGYITRSRSSEDERIVMISLTQKGVEFYNGLSDIPGKIGSCVCLDSKKAGELYTLLYELLGSMQENQ
ncbi:MarR family transcriptional regulator [Ruminococcus sp. NK3A76]|uniref:MarR family winged helix-turn-helix transcriptional regulator n=1 Tax=Ruminococcus sp. NK3A76 TaxID=877411 RepID=UPI00048FF812|nr:MarR family transcriptional regulator [Ruminococcus sp. NK3A76]